ncbi:Hypothetical predicted protein [Mytilus galloprovincialis]|uniref:Mab-21-like HhH/H2TH-like domain-containing protein n=1 Tax=Mytilus galloprovincialis TaxID=29158 RepID=A0A8B6GYW4_MYTGA|nr:Hypothetical predicted protein [Mytilus galloprovincialis]
MEKIVRMSHRSSESPYAAKKRLRSSEDPRKQAYVSASQQSVEVIYQRVQQRDVPTQRGNISNNVVGQHTSTQVSPQMTPELRNEVVQTVNDLIHSPATVTSPDSVYERQQSNKGITQSCNILPLISENDNLGLNVSHKTRNKIIRGEYVDLDCVSWTGYDLNERYLCQHLINIAGSELEMRQRQQLFIVQDMLYNAYRSNIYSRLTKISSGSLAEGIDLPGNDIDIMYVIEDIEVIRDVRNIKHPVQRTLLVMEADNDHPGFAGLRLIPEVHIDSCFIPTKSIKYTRKGSYLSTYQFVCNIIKIVPHLKLSPHGPSLTDKDQFLDFVFCLRSKYLPYNALQWTLLYRRQWPPNSVIDKIKEYGCLIVPIGPRILPDDCNVLWRIVFSLAEKQLVHSFNFTQLLCYYLLKLTLKYIVNTNKDTEGLLCSYFLKTALFWVSEEIDIDTFQLSKLYFCFSHCLSKVILWVNNCYCPNYFIPEQNMFIGKIRPDNNKTLIDVLNKIKCDGIDGLERNLFQHSDRSLHTQRESSFIMVDLLFYRVALNSATMVDLSQC